MNWIRHSLVDKIRLRPRTRLLDRLLGLETEYATLFVPASSDVGTLDAQAKYASLPAAKDVYDAIAMKIRQSQPTAPDVYDKERFFLASGGAVSLETHPLLHSVPGGLIEAATPEVRSIYELVACQRALDQLVEEAAATADLPRQPRVLKNSYDGQGHVFGCQENYEAIVASGLGLVLYRAFILGLWLIQLVSFLIAFPVLVTFAGFALVWQAITLGTTLTHRDPNEVFAATPSWMLKTMMRSLRVLHWPTVIVLRFVGRHIAFRRQRRYLTALLVSRVIVTSTGMLDADGRFRLSAKAMATDRVADMGGFCGEHPIYVYGHWLTQLCAKSFFTLSETRQLLRKNQRLQIGLSDSNLADLAEYVKVGSVALVLDLIERGDPQRLPVLKRPLCALEQINRDWNLIASVRTNMGELSAFDIQRQYLREATRFVESVPVGLRGEAPKVIARWVEALDVITQFRRNANALEPALGKIDWMSKLWMLNQLPQGTHNDVRQKLSLRYHELSGDGYFRKLLARVPSAILVSESEIEQRRRTPPSDTPAAKRGWMIREFAGLDHQLRASWAHATVSSDNGQRRVEFDNSPARNRRSLATQSSKGKGASSP